MSLASIFVRGCQRHLINRGVRILSRSLIIATATSSLSAATQTSESLSGHKIQVSDPVAAKKLEAHGGQLLADYGSYKLYDVPQNVTGIATNAASEFRDAYNTVMLNTRHLDTTKAETRALRKSVAKFEGKRLHLIQFVGPILPAWRDQLEAAGVQIISYIPHNAYLVYGDTKSIAQLQGFATKARHVQWDGSYLNDYKIHPAARSVDSNGKARQIGTDLFAIQLVADAAANANTLNVLNRLKLGPLARHKVTGKYVNLVVRLNADSLNAVAAQPDVISILPYFMPKKFCERQDQIIAGNLLGSQLAGPGYMAWLASKGFTQAQFDASGFTVDVTDSGIDNGSTAPNHFGLYTSGNTNATSRVVYARLEGDANTNSTLEGCDGHGTLNSHIIGGYDDLSGFPFADSSGYHYGLGVCPFVKVGSSVIFDPLEYTYPDYFNLQSEAYQDGARISNNSWGAPAGGEYTFDSQSYDALVRDAQPDESTYATPGNQEMVIVFAAGNDGSDSQTVGSPGTAKNVITVGAAENIQAFGDRDGSGISDTLANNADDIGFFSSRGPCLDGRHKPEIVAPGTHVSGGVPQDPAPSSLGTASSCFNGFEVSGGPGGSLFFPTNQQFYTASSGTSHSTPCVAGGCALVRQYFINNFTNPPSPAMTKAYLVNSARYLTGVGAHDTLWSDNQGFGEMNLGAAFDGAPQILRDQLPGDLFTESGQSRTITGTISDTNKPFRVTLAWTDAPGITFGSAYNNNLDLIVTINGNVYKGNVFSGPYSVPGGSADVRDNLEAVYLPAGISGNFRITVLAANINSDGVPNNGTPMDQDFALAVYNAAEGAVPVTVPAGNAVVAESSSPTNGIVDSGETVTVNFALQNVGSATASSVVATLESSGGVAFPSSPQNYGDLLVGDSAVSRPFTFLADGDCGNSITATLKLASGTTNLGLATFNFTLGQKPEFAENFDDSAVPGLPANWSSAVSGEQVAWVTANDAVDSTPNAAFAATPDVSGISELISPVIPITSSNAQLVFQNWYDIESDPDYFIAYDAGVLEISIDGSPFTDILDAGGTFVSGGYVLDVDNEFFEFPDDNPLDGRHVWSGSSGGYIKTVVNLPSSAAGKNIQLKWRCATDSGNAYASATPGWHIDSIQILDTSYSCVLPVVDLGVSQTAPDAVLATNLSYTITVTNAGILAARGITVTDALPPRVSFVSATTGAYADGNFVCNISPLQAGASTNITVTIIPGYTNRLTNVVTVAATGIDSNPLNNTSTLLSPVLIPPYPVIITQPQGMTVLGGANALLTAEVTGDAPLSYQWRFNGNNLSDATDLALNLTNVQSTNAGNYVLVVTNAQGTATSFAAQLIVLISPTLGAPAFDGTNVSMTIDSVFGARYTLQYKTNLNDPVWLPLQSATGNGAPLTLTDGSAVNTSRFYRIMAN